MTPKEKAKELVNKMYNTEHCGIQHIPNKNYCDCVEMNDYQAKQCALIAADEVIEYLTSSSDIMISVNALEYWQEVKQAIQEL